MWQGPRSGGAFTALSLNFETFGTGNLRGKRSKCHSVPGCRRTHECKWIRSYLFHHRRPRSEQPVFASWRKHLGNHECHSSFRHRLQHLPTPRSTAPAGASINPNQFPISSVAIDTSDSTGNTAYVTVMGFTGGPGHIWQTTTAGANWIDFSGTGTNAIPDSPVNAVVVDPNFARHLRRHRRRCLSKSDIDRRLDRTRTNLKRGISRLSAQRRRHRARNLQFRRTKIAASFHLRSGRVAIQSARRTGFSNLRANRYANHLPRQHGKFHRHTHIAQRL